MRKEKDSLGELEIPDEAYYGVQTQRAVVNFPVSGIRAHAAMIRATVMIKKSAARVNMDLERLDKKIGDAVIQASDEILSGNLKEHFVVDVFQAGAGTSHNMNTNEVIANRGIEILGGKRGNYSMIHPNDHVNMSQSTNDVIPTAIRLAALDLLSKLLTVIETTKEAFYQKGKEFDQIIKSGRTHLQDAVPIRLGQEFGAYGKIMEKHHKRITEAMKELQNLGIGGTAAGTGINAHPEYPTKMAETLSKETGFDLTSAEDRFEAMQSMAPFAAASGAVKNLAVDLTKIANDLRLMDSGPRTGLGEIHLPPVQPGSSIMPGKVNPVMAEMLNMVCYHVIGQDFTITLASQAGQLELNVMMPLIAFSLLYTVDIFTNGIRVFTERCVSGITADEERCREFAEKTVALVTALNPFIGYQRAAEAAKESIARGIPIRKIIEEKEFLSKEELEKVLDLSRLTDIGIPGDTNEK
jgi:aspartate ammonia-lyase